ncbi:unnamed protein product [Dovyalis caffra]|uniref:Uncharacterized protein n=1 Tax=Dovyalis caffra TaxID=77055 RepID=A0AAV1QVA6_9ROSI|nr:unnamed protein product [Dovyalis caffra]
MVSFFSSPGALVDTLVRMARSLHSQLAGPAFADGRRAADNQTYCLPSSIRYSNGDLLARVNDGLLVGNPLFSLLLLSNPQIGET